MKHACYTAIHPICTAKGIVTIMWPALFIIALIPLFFAWSDSILEFFPQMKEYLPETTKKEPEGPALAPENNPDDPAYVPPQTSQWTQQSTEQGYVAWAMSLDGSYRLTVGCAPQQAPSLLLQTIVEENGELRVSSVQDEQALLNYNFGVLATPHGQAQTGLIDAVAQFGKMSFQSSNGATTYARFQVDSYVSQTIARELTQQCANP